MHELYEMKKLFIVPVFLLVVSLFFSACTSRSERLRVEADLVLETLHREYVPDSRIEWWDMDLIVRDDLVVLEGSLASRDIYSRVVRSMNELFPGLKIEVLLLPVEDDGRLVNALVNNSVCHLRREPSSKTELLTQSLLGTPIRILKTDHDMALIQLPDGYLGWTNHNEIHALSAEEMEAYREAGKVVFKKQYGFSYCEPDASSLPVSDLVLGSILTLEGESGEFYQVHYPDGREAWVLKQEFMPAEELFFSKLGAPDLVNTALAYNGVPYLWGGSSAKNIDCSGFVSNIYYMHGIQLPRDADQQSLCGRVICEEYSSTELETGDLLFFGRKATADESERVSHVGVYLGEGEFIHAAGWRDRVSINSMDSTRENYIERYPEIFVRATRILGEEGEGFRPLAENDYYKAIISTKNEE